jgi:asparagine synthase (glutamine-hydrolysing)
MCGIAGIFGPGANNIRINKMVKAQNHRGPDGHGVFSEENIALGHTRLSIIDLSQNGNQPMYDNEGRYVIVFNGEVYNFESLKNEFLKNDVFNSGNDTETLLLLYKKLGVKMLEHLRGMFAFVIYDKLTKEIFGARDRMGIKPLLYYKDDDNFIFASELKSICSSDLIETFINKKALRQLFMYGSIQYPNTMVQGILSIPPAHYFTVNNNVLSISNYWSFPTQENFTGSFEEACIEFEKLYQESISLRMISDRKVGVFLSSGLDSASILAELKELEVKSVETFTIGFSGNHEKFFDEIEKAKSLSNFLGYKNNCEKVNVNDIDKYLNDYLKAIDQPSIDGFNTYLVSNLSKEHLTVALSGLGGDELMLGYPRNINLFNKTRQKIKLPIFISDWILKNRIEKGVNIKFLNWLFNSFGNPSNIKLNYWSNRLIMTTHEANKLFKSNISLEEDLEDFYKFDELNYQGNLFNKLSYYEIRSFMLSQLLRDMDVVSMSQSIEVRFPLIDHKLIEFIFSLPPHFKFNFNSKSLNNKTGKGSYNSSGMKYLLVKLFEKKLPKGFMDTPKQGFQLPVVNWFKSKYSSDLKQMLCLDFSEKFGFDINLIEKYKEKLGENEFNNIHFLLLMTASWENNFKTNNSK